MKKDDNMPSYNLGLGLSQLDSQSPVPYTTSVPDPSTAGVNEYDGLKMTTTVNRELSIKKPAEKNPKESDEPSSKKGKKNESATTYDEQEASHSMQPKLTKVVVPKKHDEKRLAYYTLYVIRLTKLNSELSQDELTISNEPLFDGCGDKEATRASMLILKPGE
ncbi:hypothetical protein Cgig2_015445 [Carnegiea gigantea]|uniref:Uncharacterized protein n=1 Tax=Carnegiea gigantea TaxID=171969 RepID=A0A9Q1Q8N1_9CARY|nr:hypothetical protein Cgig2_015445 [Carnegiea gigantea]